MISYFVRRNHAPCIKIKSFSPPTAHLRLTVFCVSDSVTNSDTWQKIVVWIRKQCRWFCPSSRNRCVLYRTHHRKTWKQRFVVMRLGATRANFVLRVSSDNHTRVLTEYTYSDFVDDAHKALRLKNLAKILEMWWLPENTFVQLIVSLRVWDVPQKNMQTLACCHGDCAKREQNSASVFQNTRAHGVP